MSEIALAEALYQSTERFRRRSIMVTCGVIAVIAAMIVAALWIIGQPFTVYVYPAVAGMIAGVGFVLALRGSATRGVLFLCFATTVTASAFLMSGTATELFGVANIALVVLMLLAAFLMPPASARSYGGFTVLALVVVAAYQNTGPRGDVYTLLSASSNVGLFGLTWAIATFVSNHYHDNAELLHRRLQDIDGVVAQAQRIATGDLGGDVVGDNDVSLVIRGMLDGLRRIVGQVQEGVHILGSAAGELAAMATQQQRGASEQSSAVLETQRAMDSVAESARKIADASRDVLRNAESTLDTHDTVSHRIAALIDHTQRINELLELIKNVSNKSEVLALNAALEGIKAGESGRGFSLVAAQMQRLAESTRETVKDVKSLMTDIDAATSATVLSMEQASKLASDTATAARAISLITQQQKTGVEQIVAAMKEIGSVTEEVSNSTQESMAAADELKQLSERLGETVHRFVL